MSAIVLEGVRKDFGRVVAVQGLNFTVESGCFLGLIGHNGAGKSTTLRMMTGLLRPTEGRILIDGIDVHQSPQEARRRFGAVTEAVPVYPYLTGREFLRFVSEVRGAGDVDEALALTDLGADADRLLREYSQGMRRKTALAAALMGDPSVLFLDEALNGFDPPSAARVKRLLRDRVDRGLTVILSTHVVQTIQEVADRVIMLAHGQVVADEYTDNIGSKGLESLFLERMARAYTEAP